MRPTRTSRATSILATTGAALLVAGLTTGTAGATGRGVGDARAASVGPHAVAARTTFTNWPTYHGGVGRAGRVVKGVGAPLHPAWHRNLGEVDGEPIIVNSAMVLATQDNVVHGLDPATGQGEWQVSLGTPVPGQQLQCGYLDAIGIISTPAYDYRTKTVFVVAETTGGTHTLWALDPANGAKKWSRNLDVMPDQDPLAVKNRAAIAVIGSRVLVSFGSAGGDCGSYVGYLTSTPTDGAGATTHYATPSTNNAGMWTPAGPVLGRDGSVYMAVGEGAATGTDWDMSDSVLELDPVSLSLRSAFAPSSWASDNAHDLDLGSSSPAQLPDLQRMVQAGKAGTVYLLPEHLGGAGSEIAHLDGCNAYAGSAVVGDDVIMNCQVNRQIRQLKVTAGGISWGWTAPAKLVGSPVVAGGRVFVADRVSGHLVSLDLDTGKVLQTLPLGETTHFPSVVVDGGYVYANTMSGVSAFHG